MSVLRRYRDTIPTGLTPDELRERGHALAELCQQIDSAEAEEADRRKGVKEHIAALEEQRTGLAYIIHRGEEDRATDIEESADYAAGKASTVRLDTGEVIRERPLRAEERQGTIADVLQATAAAVNAGALDSPGVTVRADVRCAPLGKT